MLTVEKLISIVVFYRNWKTGGNALKTPTSKKAERATYTAATLFEENWKLLPTIVYSGTENIVLPSSKRTIDRRAGFGRHVEVVNSGQVRPGGLTRLTGPTCVSVTDNPYCQI